MERTLTPRGAATRQRIVESAAELVRERGVAETGLDDIGTAAATSRSQLFHYFPGGKADLLEAVAAHEAAQVLAEQQPFLAELSSSWDSWRDWRDSVVAHYAAEGGNCALGALTTELGRTPASRAIIQQMYDEWAGQLADGVRALQQAGAVDAGRDSSVIAAVILSAVQGGAVMLQATGRIDYLEAALDEALAALRH